MVPKCLGSEVFGVRSVLTPWRQWSIHAHDNLVYQTGAFCIVCLIPTSFCTVYDNTTHNLFSVTTTVKRLSSSVRFVCQKHQYSEITRLTEHIYVL